MRKSIKNGYQPLGEGKDNTPYELDEGYQPGTEHGLDISKPPTGGSDVKSPSGTEK